MNWHEQMNTVKVLCGYCRKKIPKYTLYYSKIKDLDSTKERPKNVCMECVAKSQDKKVV
jgi:hypothetical protein